MSKAVSAKGSSMMKIVCAVLFWVFSLCYLYFYQADILAVGQHVLSHGMTHYNRTFGALLITLALYLLQVGVYSLSHLERRAHAMSYFPSLLLLAMLTDVGPKIDEGFSFGAWLWVPLILLVLFVGFVYVYRQYQAYEPDDKSTGFFSRLMWINLLELTVMFFLVGIVSNGNEVFHYRMGAEQCLINEDYEGATRLGYKSANTDSSLTMIRAYALSCQGQLGERLFEYPLEGGSDALLPNGQSVKLMMYPESEMYRHFGLRLKQKLSALAYFEFLERHHRANQTDIDYLLTGYLMDRRLGDFARTLTRHYDLNKPLPKHYKEALTLYNHQSSNPSVLYKDNVMETDFQDYQDLAHSEKNLVARANRIRSTYGNTYWYYYQYAKPEK